MTNVTTLGNYPANHFADDVRKGLAATPKAISSKYFYDERGSSLFEEIMGLEEYYPTRCEQQIFESHKENILQAIGGRRFRLIDLGAGDAKKTKILLRHFQQANADFLYVPIDISEDALEQLTDDLDKGFPGLPYKALSAEYFEALQWLNRQPALEEQGKGAVNVVLFMGSNIGNFNKADAVAFLEKMHSVLNPQDYLLLGVDLKKDPRTIRAAYDDSKGITAQFNLNLLRRMNEELGANFDLGHWQHYAEYNLVTGAAESFLLPNAPQQVVFGKMDRFHVDFDAWEPIHTEYSMKYSMGELRKLAHQTGFSERHTWFSSGRWFTDMLWERV